MNPTPSTGRLPFETALVDSAVDHSAVENSERQASLSSVMGTIREVENLVDSLTAGWLNRDSVLPSRRVHRVRFVRPMALVPLVEATQEPADKPRRVVGRDISCRGLSFQHDLPLPCRVVAVTIPQTQGPARTVVLRLKWCRFTRAGHYCSGGAFLRCRNFGWEGGLDLSSLPIG